MELLKYSPLVLQLTIFQILQLCPTTNSERILVLDFVSSKSHKITYMTLIEELANKGHNITVISPIKPFKVVKNIKEIYTYDVDKEMMDKFDPLKMKANNEKFNPLAIIKDIERACTKTYNLPQVREVINSKEKFDLIFMQPAINECVLGIVFKLQAPLVLFSPTVVPDFVSSKIGTRMPPSFVPHMMLDYPNEMNFFQRAVNFGMNMMYEVGSYFLYEPVMQKIYREQLGDPNIPSMREILANASLILSNGHFSLSGPRPYLQDVIDVGGIHSKPAKKLPENLEKFVSKNGTKGFIYFSMGTVVKTHQMPEEKRQMFLKVFSRLSDYQIVWKWNEDERMENQPENLLLSKWLPQQDILGHDRIKMFITHCGMGGIEESIYNGVPLLGFPIMGDQPMNAKQAKRMGILVELDWNELTEESVYEGIIEVLENKKYSQNVKRLSTIFKDQPETPLKRGVYWIEYVMRHKGAPHLRSAARKLNYFQYHSWDVIGVYLALICTIIWILYALVKFCFRKVSTLIFGKGEQKKKV